MNIPHGTQLGNADGQLMEVFRPRWRLWLWVAWFWPWNKRAKGVVSFYNDDERVDLRVWDSKMVLPRVGSRCASVAKPVDPRVSKI